ncbi:hypothetical protein I601_3349 [Nocardioides dokdonensis FR1436]|uniref:Acyl-CoA dehydrogenase n=1 Tax=Nocardioides dokdonensis FR1436 TaxID=1300347 RepID=A0A1A9GQN7_9ACTN|nr:hypothetical protein [Nocardioides dokdonensis]ANH39755.1 hypothetical protein I601_3349 [Nocardioides dokdonensis FR1436]
MSTWVSLETLPDRDDLGAGAHVLGGFRRAVVDAVEGVKRGDLTGHLEVASAVGDLAPRPADGSTRILWEALATLGAHDLQLARAVEPHLDALAILTEASTDRPRGEIPQGSTWGVFAAEGPGARLTARGHDGGWVLDGTKPWCSLATRLSHALVTAWVDDEQRGLFAVDLHHPGVRAGAAADDWVARGLPDVVSTAIDLDAVPATAVGEPGWYLRRDGFAWGGIGVAAVWYGGAVGLARRLSRPGGRVLDQVGHLHLGRVDQHLSAARAVLGEAARSVDSGRVGAGDAAALANRVRSVVAASAEAVLESCEHALGPGPQVAEPAYAAALADLRLYLRQHHAERDLAALGREADRSGAWWSR